MALIISQSRREHRRGRKVVVFVRNDPVYLLAASLLRGRIDRVVFQSSFPHEESGVHVFKRATAKCLYRIAGRGVDAVTAVSPSGMLRIRRLFPQVGFGTHIPLLSDLRGEGRTVIRESGDRQEKTPLFVYIGTHDRGRELDVVLQGIVCAINRGASARFLFIGGTNEDIKRLSTEAGVKPFVKDGSIAFVGHVTRAEISQKLTDADIGLSLIPPNALYSESCPTKLAEYMGAGLVVLASRGIPMQEKFVSESEGGMLVDWNSESIAGAVCTLAQDFDNLDRMKENARNYALVHLQYSNYLGEFKKLIGVANG
ncbi:MAG: glycosyltransferase [Kiritimatiellae bacterium]|nr:glycosyltransferase [Kiritimatiellia bacterium]